MRWTRLALAVSAALFLAGMGVCATEVASQEQVTAPAATAVEVQGNVQRLVGGTWQPLQVGMNLHEQDQIRTFADGAAVLFLVDKNGVTGRCRLYGTGELALGRLEQDPVSGNKRTQLDLAVGRVLVHVEERPEESTFEVKTPVSTVGVRGTDFAVDYDRERTLSVTTTYKGIVAVSRRRRETGAPALAVSEAPVLVHAGMRTSVHPVEGIKAPSVLSPEELNQGLQAANELGSLTPQGLSPRESQEEKEVGGATYRGVSRHRGSRPGEGGQAESSEETGKTPGFDKKSQLFLLGIGLLVFGLLRILTAWWAPSRFNAFLLGAALIAAAAWIFQSQGFQPTDLTALLSHLSQLIKH